MTCRIAAALAAAALLACPALTPADEKDQRIAELEAQLAAANRLNATLQSNLSASDVRALAMEKELADAKLKAANAQARADRSEQASEQLRAMVKDLSHRCTVGNGQQARLSEQLAKLQAEKEYLLRQVKLLREQIDPSRRAANAGRPNKPNPPKADDEGPAPIAARVTSVTQTHVMLDKGSEAGVRDGQEFAIRRDGKVVAKVKAVAVQVDSVLCMIVEPGLGAKVGDEARAAAPPVVVVGKVGYVKVTAEGQTAFIQIEAVRADLIKPGMTTVITDNPTAAAEALKDQTSASAPPRERGQPPIKAKIQSIDGKHVTLNVGSEDGVTVGMRFTVFRGANYLAEAVVERVEAGSCTGRVELMKNAIQVGDDAWNKVSH